MKSQEIDKLVEVTLNPYLVVKVELNHTEDELETLFGDFEGSNFGKEFDQNCIGIDITYNTKYIIMRKGFLENFINFLNKNSLDYIITDGLSKIWNMGDVSEFKNLWDENNDSDLIKVGNSMTILKLLVNQKYSVDNVLDKISDKGIGSLNELNQYILNKESH